MYHTQSFYVNNFIFRLKVVYVSGKRHRKVPILFTEETIAAVRLLLATRSNVGIAERNKFVFARQYDSQNHIDGWQAVKSVVMRANLNKPELITSMRIRKELAITLQLLDMNGAELTWVTNHLGHSVSVDKQWYRQEESTMELTKVAKVLIAKYDGTSFKNKKVDDLDEHIEGTILVLYKICMTTSFSRHIAKVSA